MKLTHIFVIVIILFLGHSAFAMERGILTEEYFVDNFELEFQTGLLVPGYNDVQIPGTSEGTRFSLVDDLEADNEAFFRLALQYSIDDRHHFTFLYTPNTINATGTLTKDIIFDGTTFLTDSKIEATYVFNTIRLQYRWDFILTKTIEFGLGLTAFIRDAEISLQNTEDADNKASYDNVGFVGLLNFRFVARFSDELSVHLKGDLFAVSAGRAENIFVGLVYQASEEFAFQFGYRIIEGGADNDKVYTFALINYFVFGLVYNF